MIDCKYQIFYNLLSIYTIRRTSCDICQYVSAAVARWAHNVTPLTPSWPLVDPAAGVPAAGELGAAPAGSRLRAPQAAVGAGSALGAGRRARVGPAGGAARLGALGAAAGDRSGRARRARAGAEAEPRREPDAGGRGDGRTDGRGGGRTGGRTGGGTDWRTDRRTSGLTRWQTDERTNGRTKGRADLSDLSGSIRV